MNQTINPFRFGGAHGYYTDVETGRVNVRARTYEPTVARWTSKDPLPQSGPNPYQYAENSPCNHVDPSGMFAVAGNVAAAALKKALEEFKYIVESFLIHQDCQALRPLFRGCDSFCGIAKVSTIFHCQERPPAQLHCGPIRIDNTAASVRAKLCEYANRATFAQVPLPLPLPIGLELPICGHPCSKCDKPKPIDNLGRCTISFSLKSDQILWLAKQMGVKVKAFKFAPALLFACPYWYEFTYSVRWVGQLGQCKPAEDPC